MARPFGRSGRGRLGTSRALGRRRGRDDYGDSDDYGDEPGRGARSARGRKNSQTLIYAIAGGVLLAIIVGAAFAMSGDSSKKKRSSKKSSRKSSGSKSETGGSGESAVAEFKAAHQRMKDVLASTDGGDQPTQQDVEIFDRCIAEIETTTKIIPRLPLTAEERDLLHQQNAALRKYVAGMRDLTVEAVRLAVRLDEHGFPVPARDGKGRLWVDRRWDVILDYTTEMELLRQDHPAAATIERRMEEIGLGEILVRESMSPE